MSVAYLYVGIRRKIPKFPSICHHGLICKISKHVHYIELQNYRNYCQRSYHRPKSSIRWSKTAAAVCMKRIAVKQSLVGYSARCLPGSHLRSLHASARHCQVLSPLPGRAVMFPFRVSTLTLRLCVIWVSYQVHACIRPRKLSLLLVVERRAIYFYCDSRLYLCRLC